MGEYTTFVCRECGYTADRIRWGVSVYDPRKRFMPAYCVESQALIVESTSPAPTSFDEFHCAVRQPALLSGEGSLYLPQVQGARHAAGTGRVLVRRPAR